jgi:glycosidase
MADLKSIVNKWQTFMIENNGWNALFLENHDQGRAISRFASDKPKWREIASKMVATFLGFQSGTVFIYQGQELAQANVPESWTIDMFRDIETLNHWKDLGESNPSNVRQRQVAMSQYKIKSRDNARTPMQWDGSKNAGFTTNDRPWMDVHEDYRTWNAASQVTRSDSAYNYWAAMLRLRKELPNIFVYGDFKLVSPENEDVFAYLRVYDESQTALVVANFREDIVDWRVPAEAARHFTGQSAAMGNYEKPPTLSDATVAIQLRPFEAFVLVNRPDRQQSAEI